MEHQTQAATLLALDIQSSGGCGQLDDACSIALHSANIEAVETHRRTYDNCRFVWATVVVHGHHDMRCLVIQQGPKVG